jgi:hypothetical protein
VTPLGIATVGTAQPVSAAVAGPIIPLVGRVATSGIGALAVVPKARIFPVGTSATGQSGSVRIGGEPVWAGSDPVALGELARGATYNLTQRLTTPADAALYAYSRTGSGSDTAAAGFAVNSTTGVLTIPSNAAAGGYQIEVDAVPVAVQLTTLTLTGGGAGKAWTFGHAFKQGDVPAGRYITATGPTSFQADARNYWPDGSVKFAAISGVGGTSAVLSSGVTNTMTGTAIATSALSAVTARIDFGASNVTWSGTDWSSPFRTVTSGPVMSSWTYRKQIGSDTHLVGWLEVRAYAGGAVEVLPWIENGYLNVSSPTTKSGRAIFTLGGTTRYDSNNDANYTTAYSVSVVSSGTLNIAHHTRVVLVSGGTTSHWVGTFPGVTPVHDLDYFASTKTVPGYRDITPVASVMTGLENRPYSPMRQRFIEDGMGGTGGTSYISLLPQEAGLYLMTGDVRAYHAVIAQGFSLASFAIHYRDETTNRPLLFASYPTLSINIGNMPPTPSGSIGYYYASSHHPAAAYVPYLLTGWNWFVEEIQFQTTLHYLARNASYRQNDDYYFYSSANGPGMNEQGGPRAQAWQWRTCAMTASVTPDADTVMRGQFVDVLNFNANYWRVEHDTGAIGRSYAPNPLGMPCEPGSVTEDGKWVTGAFQIAFFAASLGLCSDLEVTTGTSRTDLIWFRDFAYGGVVGWFGRQNVATEWNYQYAANYQIYIGPAAQDWYGDWGEAFTAKLGNANSGYTGTDLRGGNYPEASSYWGNVQAAISYAVEHGKAGALDGYNRMVGASNWSLFLSNGSNNGLNYSPRDAYKPRNVA